MCQAHQYDIYCWALDSAVNTAGWARQNIMQQSYVVTDVTSATSPTGGGELVEIQPKKNIEKHVQIPGESSWHTCGHRRFQHILMTYNDDITLQ